MKVINMKWLDFYKNEYIKTLDSFNQLRKSDCDVKVLCNGYTNMVNISCELMKLFINYQGLFQFENREIIKEAFYVGLINDGEKWINALTLADVCSSGEEKFNNLIISYCKDENFVIFESLNTIFKNYSEEYEKDS